MEWIFSNTYCTRDSLRYKYRLCPLYCILEFELEIYKYILVGDPKEVAEYKWNMNKWLAGSTSFGENPIMEVDRSPYGPYDAKLFW